MSGEPKTLTPQAMTLGEALAAVRAKAKADGPAYKVTEVRFMPFAHYPWWVEMAYGDVKVYADWPPALSFALGVPVVARDEAAELRAVLKRVGEVLDDIGACIVEVPPSSDAYADANEILGLLSKANEAMRPVLRRLAGGESEKP